MRAAVAEVLELVGPPGVQLAASPPMVQAAAVPAEAAAAAVVEAVEEVEGGLAELLTVRRSSAQPCAPSSLSMTARAAPCSSPE